MTNQPTVADQRTKISRAEQNEALRVRAAKQAAKIKADPVADEIVTARILKKGDGKVSMGQHIGGIGEVHYEFGETPKFPRSIAEALEERGFVEIQP